MTLPIFIGFSTTDNWLGRGIRWFESWGHGTPANVSHAFFAYKAALNSPWMILGEDENGLVHTRAANFQATIVSLYNPQFSITTAFNDDLAKMLGSQYDYGALFGMIFVELCEREHIATQNPFASKDKAFCSEYVTEVLQRVLPVLSLYANLIPSTVDPWTLEQLISSDKTEFIAVGDKLP